MNRSESNNNRFSVLMISKMKKNRQMRSEVLLPGLTADWVF